MYEGKNYCHNQIRASKQILNESKQQFASLVADDVSTALSSFLKQRSQSVRSTIEARHAKKFANLINESDIEYIPRISIKKIGSSICPINRSRQLNAPFSRKDRNLLRLHQRSQPKISSVKLRPPLPVYQKTPKITYEPLLLPFFTELVYHLTVTSPKMKRKHSKT